MNVVNPRETIRTMTVQEKAKNRKKEQRIDVKNRKQRAKW